MTQVEARRPRHRPSRRSEVISAAVRVFAREGPDASVAEIASEAGMAPAAIYYHFDSKDHLLGAALDQVSQEVSERTRDAEGNLLGLDEVTRNVWDWMASHEDAARLLYLWMVPAATEADAARRRFFERHVLQSGRRVRQGTGRMTVIERLAARTVVTLTLKVSIAHLAEGEDSPWTKDEIVDALSETMTRVLTAPHELRAASSS